MNPMLFDSHAFYWNPRSQLLFCKEQQKELTPFCDDLLKYSLTNEGICLSYNALSISQVLKDSDYQQIASSVFEADEAGR